MFKLIDKIDVIALFDAKNECGFRTKIAKRLDEWRKNEHKNISPCISPTPENNILPTPSENINIIHVICM